MQFTKAQRKKAKLRLAITGPSGSGKTTAALNLATGLGGRIAVIDTERGSASLYSDMTDFDALELDAPYSPERFVKAIDAAEKAGYAVLIIDSLSPEWTGVGGCLELVDEIAKAKYKNNSWSAWNDITPRHRALIDRINASGMHVIVTMRSKTETAQVEENGRKKVVKLGMKAEQRDGIEYEFTVVLELSHDGHYAAASKDRTGKFADPARLTPAHGEMLAAWLESGEEPKPKEQIVSKTNSARGEALERVPEEKQAILRDFAMEIIGKFEDDAMSAFDLFREKRDQNQMDDDEITVFWHCLPSNIRTKFKDIGQQSKVA